MEESKLEKKMGFISIVKKAIEEIGYVGFDHYLMDVTGHIMDKEPIHYHKENHTSKDSPFLHARFYKE